LQFQEVKAAAASVLGGIGVEFGEEDWSHSAYPNFFH